MLELVQIAHESSPKCPLRHIQKLERSNMGFCGKVRKSTEDPFLQKFALALKAI
jgi:hypothetical protein